MRDAPKHTLSGAGCVLALSLLLVACSPSPGDKGHADEARAPDWHGMIRDGPALESGDAAPEPVILTYRVVSPEEAEALNAQMPVSTAPMSAAAPFRLPAAMSQESRHAAVDCMTAAIYYEAGSEGETDQRSIAQVVLNRIRHPAFPKSVCDVVFQGSERPTGCQFTFTCDGALDRRPDPARWAQARAYAEQALDGTVEKAVGLSTHYHARQVAPYPREDLTKLAVIGGHIFYQWQGGHGLPARAQATAIEMLPRKLAASIPDFVRIGPSSREAGNAPLLRPDGQIAPLSDLRAASLTTDDRAGAMPGSRDPHLKTDDKPGRPTADERSGAGTLRAQ